MLGFHPREDPLKVCANGPVGVGGPFDFSPNVVADKRSGFFYKLFDGLASNPKGGP